MSCTDCASNEILYVGNGSLVLYTFPFTYYSESDVYVELYNFTTRRWEKTTDWTFANATTVQFNTAPPAPPSTDPSYPNIRIARCTDIDPLAATFYPGSAIRAQDLNNNFEMLQMAIQEGRCFVPDWLFDYLEKYYWNKGGETIKSGDTWISDNDHIATTAAADARFSQGGGGGGSGSPVIVSDTPPTSVPLDGGGSRPLESGDQWFDSDTGDLFVWYTDIDSSQWINVSHTGPQGPQGPEGPTGPPGPGGGGTVNTITGTLPITVNSTDAANPVVGINAATTTTVGAVQIETTVSNSTTNTTTGSAVQAYAVRLNFSNLAVLP